MQEPSRSKPIKIIRGCSQLLMWAGAAVFLIGGKFLYEIRHVNFVSAEAAGILGGAFLMLLGFVIGMAGKTSSPGQ